MDNEKCPNPFGVEGICYSFDRFGDRTGCLGCPLADTIPGGVFDMGDPLPGLTRQLEEQHLINLIKLAGKSGDKLTLSSHDCIILTKLIGGD